VKSALQLEALVFGERRPDLPLNTTGVIPASWFDDYERLLGAALLETKGDTWPRALVQSAHWVSFYLPLRLHVALATRGVEPSVRDQVSHAHLITERMLWGALGTRVSDEMRRTLKAEQPVQSSAHELIRISLGAGNPVRRCEDTSFLKNWRDEFEQCWGKIGVMLVESEMWPKWTVAAARFASFYVDLLLRQRIEVDYALRSEATSLESVLPDEVIALASRFLAAWNMPREQSGLPAIGSARVLDHFSVRRLVEPVLLARTAQPNATAVRE
jgi:hypothetical protein